MSSFSLPRRCEMLPWKLVPVRATAARHMRARKRCKATYPRYYLAENRTLVEAAPPREGLALYRRRVIHGSSPAHAAVFLVSGSSVEMRDLKPGDLRESTSESVVSALVAASRHDKYRRGASAVP